MFYLILISLVWTLVALFLALLQPWLGIYASGLSQVVDFAAPITTAALILVGTGHALRRFLQTRQLIATIPLTITLFLLFTLLFFQIGTHLGAGHYTYENSPSWYDWVVFSLVHGFRAGDPADTLEAYGWQIQSIQHHSHTTSIAVLAFHLVMGLFLITFVAGLLHQLVIDKLSRALANTNNRKARTLLFRLTVAGYIAVVVFFVAISLLTFSPFASREFQYQMTFETIFILVAIFGMAMVLCCLLPSALYSLLALVRVKGNNEPFDRNCWLYTFTIFITFITFWAASVFIFRPWESQDLLLWPMDNLLRIVDVLDIMEVYHLHLHNIPRIGWESTLTLFSRLLLVFFFGEILVWVFSELSLRFGNGALLSYEALQEVHASHPNPAIRSRAGRLLDQAPPPAKFYSPGSWGLLSGAGAVGVVLLVSFLTIPTMSAHWNDAAIQLAKTAIDRKDPRAEAALVQLKKMGPNGYAAIPTIVQAIPKAPLPKKKVLIATLGHLGREAVPPLEKILLGPEEQLAVEAVWALRRIGPVTVPSFSRGLDSPFPKVESAIFAAVATLESDAAQILLDSISKENAESHMELVLKIDHYWHLRPSSNKKVGELQEARELLLAFENPNQTVSNPLPSDPLLHAYRFYRQKWIPVEKLGVPLDELIANLEQCFEDPQYRVRSSAAYVLEKITTEDRPLTSLWTKVLEDEHRMIRRHAAEVLSKVNPENPKLIPVLKEWLNSEKSYDSLKACKAIGNLGKHAQPFLKDLQDQLRSSDSSKKIKAIITLGAIGPAAYPAIPELKRCLQDPDAEVGEFAKTALEKINGKKLN